MNRRKFLRGGTIAAGAGLMAPLAASAAVTGTQGPRTWPTQIIKPRQLNKGDTIGLITPSSAISRVAFENTLENMSELGFRVKYSPNMRVRKGFLAGTDFQRAADLHAMFADPEVQGIFCARGGYGSARLLPLLNYNLIKANPKVFIGYSDITALHFGILNKTGLLTFHGPVGASEFSDFTSRCFEKVVLKGKDKVKVEQAREDSEREEDQYKLRVISEGKCEGRLVGGNLSLVSSLAGTPYDLDFSGKIIFLEEVGESPYRVDRMLTQLLLAGKLQSAAGIALGVFNDCDDKPTDPDFGDTTSLWEVLTDRLGGLDIPVIYGLSFGHVKNNATLPMAVNAELDTSNARLTLLEEAVI